MAEVTRVFSWIEQDEPHAADQLLPLVYDELRCLAAAQMAGEKPGQTLDAIALVHEAYLRLVGDQQFADRRHFFLVAAEAMRRILIDRARQKRRIKYGGDRARVPLSEAEPAAEAPADDLLALAEALHRLASVDSVKAELVKGATSPVSRKKKPHWPLAFPVPPSAVTGPTPVPGSTTLSTPP